MHAYAYINNEIKHNLSDMRQSLTTIQALRALAALAVVYYHISHMLVKNAGYRMQINTIGAAGVDLFFVISGFIMMYTNADRFMKKAASQQFLKRRFIRIFPLYWIYTTILVLLLISMPTLFSHIKYNWNNVIHSYLLLLSVNVNGDIGTVLQTGWTLCYEIYFYLIFAILLNFPRNYFLMLSGIIFVTGIVLSNLVKLPVPLLVAANPIIFEFYFGALIALCFLRKRKMVYWQKILIFIVLLVALVLSQHVEIVHPQWLRLFSWGIPAAILLMVVFSLEHTRVVIPSWLLKIGDSSYSLYLIHPFILPALGKLWFKFELQTKISAYLLTCLALLVTIPVAYFLYLKIEKPLIHALRSDKGKPFLYRRQQILPFKSSI